MDNWYTKVGITRSYESKKDFPVNENNLSLSHSANQLFVISHSASLLKKGSYVNFQSEKWRALAAWYRL